MNQVIGIGPWSKFNLEINYDNIYIGDIQKCTSYYNNFDEACKHGATDVEGFERKIFQSNIIKERTILVQLNCKDRNIYIELEKFTKKNLKKYIRFTNNGGVNIFITEDGPVLLDEPSYLGDKFVNKNTLVKFDDLENKKVKKVVNKKRLTAI